MDQLLATECYEINTIKNALMLTMEDRMLGASLNAIDRVKWTTGMLTVEAIDPGITADEIVDFISKKMTLQHRKEVQHQETGNQGMSNRRIQTSLGPPPMPNLTDQRVVAARPMRAQVNLRVSTLRFKWRQWMPYWRRYMACSPPAR